MNVKRYGKQAIMIVYADKAGVCYIGAPNHSTISLRGQNGNGGNCQKRSPVTQAADR